MSDEPRSDLARWGAKAVRLMRCDRCQAAPGEPCKTVGGKNAGTEYDYYVHAVRYRPLSEEYYRGRNLHVG